MLTEEIFETHKKYYFSGSIENPLEVLCPWEDVVGSTKMIDQTMLANDHRKPFWGFVLLDPEFYESMKVMKNTIPYEMLKLIHKTFYYFENTKASKYKKRMEFVLNNFNNKTLEEFNCL